MPARPRVVVHASISVDGSMTGFEADLAAHGAAAAAIPAQARLIGSITMSSGLDREGIAPRYERWSAAAREDDPSLPYWVVVDSTGRLHGRLQPIRDFPLVRDVLLLVSHATPDSYLQHLADHRYRYLMAGGSRVDLPTALAALRTGYGVETILVDSGPTLLSVLLGQRLVDEVSLLVHPVLVGAAGQPLFAAAPDTALTLHRSSTDAAGRLLLRYRVAAAP